MDDSNNVIRLQLVARAPASTTSTLAEQQYRELFDAAAGAASAHGWGRPTTHDELLSALHDLQRRTIA